MKVKCVFVLDIIFAAGIAAAFTVTQQIGAHGSATGGASFIYTEGDPAVETVYTADEGYVIAKLDIGGVAVAAAQFAKVYTNSQIFAADTFISATFVKESAWWLEPFVRNRTIAGEGCYSPMGGDIDENEQYFVMARGPANFSDVSGFYMYDVADLADSINPKLEYAGINTKYLLSNYESFRSVTASAFYQAAFSVPRSSKHFVGYPFDSATNNTVEACYAVTNNSNSNIIPGKFSEDGMRYYGRILNGTDPNTGTSLGSGSYVGMYTVQTNALGKPQNLVYVKRWDIGGATTEQHVYDHNGTDILYVGYSQALGLRAINTVTDAIVTNVLAPGTGTIYSIYPIGIADGTPRLVVNDSLQVAVYDLENDMMTFRSSTPVVKYTQLELDPVPLPRTLQTLIPLDDDSRAFHGREFSGTRAGVSVIEKKPDTLIIERAFSVPLPNKPQITRFEVPFGGGTNITIAVPFRYKITGISTNAVPVTTTSTDKLVFPFTDLAGHVRLDVTVDGPDMTLVDPAVILLVK